MIRAVLFDAVGTLIRPYPSVGAVYARAAAAHGARCRARDLEAQFRPAYRELSPERFFGRSRLQTTDPRERRWWRKVVTRTLERAGCSPAPPGATDDAVEAFSHAAAWRPLAGAIEALRALRAGGVKLALVSNFDSRLHRVIEELGLAPYFSAVAVSSEVGWAKPSPRIFGAAVARLRVRPEEAVMVGDRRMEDYDGARAAGLHALLLDPGGRERGPHIVRSLRQVPGRLLLFAAR